MKIKTILLSCLFICVSACKAKTSESDAAQAGSGTSAAGESELCGLIELRSQVFYIKPESGASARIIDPQDGASSNVLKDAIEGKKLVCIRAKWSSKDPVMIASASAIRSNSNVAAKQEECGTVMMKQNDIIFQVSNNNSENNLDHVLEPEDGAVANVLQDLAMKMAQACISADFSKSGQPVMIKSASVVREVK